MGSRFYQSKSTGLDSAKLAETAQFIFKHLEDAFTDSRDDVIKNSKEVTNKVNHYLKKHPYASAGSTMVVAGLLAYLFAKYKENNRISAPKLRAREDDINPIIEILEGLTGDLKQHSLEIFDDVISGYVKKNPLQAAAAAIAAGLVYSFLQRR